MVSLASLFFICQLCFHSVYSITNEASVTTSSPSNNGASVSVLKDTTTKDGTWLITARDQIGFHIKLSMDSLYAFHSTQISTLTIKIGSDTATGITDCDLFVSFSQSSSKYLTYKMSIDNNGRHAMYPVCDTTSSYHSFASGDIEALCNANDDSREDKVTNDGAYGYFGPETANTGYPLIFTFENHPDSHTFVTYSDPNTSPVTCGFSPAFDANVPLEVFFATDDYKEEFSITYIDITYNDTTTTTPPTPQPTHIPTIIPTRDPTIEPTQPTVDPTAAPSINPTSAPTSTPSISPSAAPSAITESPTSAPSSAPSSSPTSAPTNNPSSAPSHVPISSPTQSPSSSPTQSPTNNPTATSASPTSPPSRSPSSAPTLSPTTNPSLAPTDAPSISPSAAPSAITKSPTSAPSNAPISPPTQSPSSPPTRSPTPQSTLVDDVWNDDFIFNGVDDFGWSLDDNVLNNQAHGPYFAGTYWLLRWFQCITYSTVSIQYKFLCCSGNDHGNIAVYINGDQQDLHQSYDFETASNRDDHSGCKAHWKELIVADIGAIVMTKHEAFYVEFRMHSYHDNDGIALSDIKVTCGPAISNSPTAEPTEPTMIPTSDPTFEPTQATVDPTAAPTQPTNNPTSAPSRSPSSAPTLAPTNNPSLAPTDAPSLTPTFDPTNKPSFGPAETASTEVIVPSVDPAHSPILLWVPLLPTNDPSEPLTSIDDTHNIHMVSSDLSITTLALIGAGFGTFVFICCVFATIIIIKKCHYFKSDVQICIELEQDKETEPGDRNDSEPSLPLSERNHDVIDAMQQIIAENVCSDSDDGDHEESSSAEDDDDEDSSELYASVNIKDKSTKGGTNLYCGEDDDGEDNEESMSEASSFSLNKKTKTHKGGTVKIELGTSPMRGRGRGRGRDRVRGRGRGGRSTNITIQLPGIHTKEGLL